MVEDITNFKELKAPKLYSQIVRLRSGDYIILITLLSLIWILGLILPVIIFNFDIQDVVKSFLFVGLEFVAFFALSFLSVYLSLAFQVFAFESSINAINAIKKSFCMVINNFWRTLFLGILLFVITGIIVPNIFEVFLKGNFVTNFISYPVKLYVSSIIPDPVALYNSLSTDFRPLISDPQNIVNEISVSITFSIVSTLITAMMLPLGTACYALLYMDIVKRKELKDKKNKK
jgi:hypothetical protein